MERWIRLAGSTLLALRVIAPSTTAAQEVVREAITIDYVGVEGVYLPVGTDRGLAVGDTLVLHAVISGPGPQSLLELISVARRRSVGRIVSADTPLARGDILYVTLPRASSPPAEPAVAPGAAAGPSRAAPDIPAARTSAAPRRPRLSGRIGLDLEARETRTSWEGDLFGDTRRRFATPVGRLSLRAEDLPGGLQFRTSARASYRYSDGAGSLPSTSVRVYDLSVARAAGPVEVRLGRFHSPYEPYGGYWDGALLRAGGRRVGVGVVAGLEPETANERPSTALRKMTGFVDVGLGGRSLRYESDLSIHLARADSGATLAFAGWSQRITVSRLSVDQRIRLDRAEDGASWSLAQLRLRGTLRLADALSVQGGYARERMGAPFRTFVPDAPPRTDAYVGMSLRGGPAAASVELGRSRFGDAPPGWSVSGWTGARAGPIDLHASARHWSREDQASLSLSPGARFQVGSVTVRTAYGLYRTSGPTGALLSHTADLGGTLTVGPGTSLSLRVQRQFGTRLQGTRISLGLWRSF